MFSVLGYLSYEHSEHISRLLRYTVSISLQHCTILRFKVRNLRENHVILFVLTWPCVTIARKVIRASRPVEIRHPSEIS